MKPERFSSGNPVVDALCFVVLTSFNEAGAFQLRKPRRAFCRSDRRTRFNEAGAFQLRKLFGVADGAGERLMLQ